MDATLIPLPSELTTPPVTKINFVGICLRKKKVLGRGAQSYKPPPQRTRQSIQWKYGRAGDAKTKTKAFAENPP